MCWVVVKIMFYVFDGVDVEGGWKCVWISGFKVMGFLM